MPLEPSKSKNKAPYSVLPKEFEESVNNVYELPSTKEIVRYLHACAGFPTKSTWIKAIKGGNYATWPHLSVEAVRKHYPESDETAQGHMKSVKEGIRSTKRKAPPLKVKLEGGEELTIPLKKHNDVYIKVKEAQKTMYTDQTGAFPVRSRKGNRYIILGDFNARLHGRLSDETDIMGAWIPGQGADHVANMSESILENRMRVVQLAQSYNLFFQNIKFQKADKPIHICLPTEP